MQVIKINNYQPVYNKPVFRKNRLKSTLAKDFFVKNNNIPLQESINEIKDILPVAFAGTKCEGAFMLPDFWKSIAPKNLAKMLKLKLCGLSTNKDGYADSFLKTYANRPVSTSFVHDCAVMYLYNDKTKTHAMYHAAPNTKVKKLDFMIKTLMPEGFTNACIIPGDYSFYREQEPNMKNMFQLIKQNNPQAVINVFYGISRFPEITGYKGQVFQIPNKEVEKQMKSGILDATDFGQASFRISDTGGYNTFDFIYGECDTIEELERLKDRFQKKKFPKLIFEILSKEIEKQKDVLTLINKSESLEELNNWNEIFTEDKFKTVFLKKREEILIKMLEKVLDENSLKQFYQLARHDFIRMSKLFKLFQEKKKEIL